MTDQEFYEHYHNMIEAKDCSVLAMFDCGVCGATNINNPVTYQTLSYDGDFVLYATCRECGKENNVGVNL